MEQSRSISGARSPMRLARGFCGGARFFFLVALGLAHVLVLLWYTTSPPPTEQLARSSSNRSEWNYSEAASVADNAASVASNAASASGSTSRGLVELTPAVHAPTVDTPTVHAPTLHAPTVDAPTVDTPTVQAPTFHAPTVDAPTVDTPAVQAPTVHAPTVDAPTVDTPAVQAPTVHAPVVQAPTFYASLDTLRDSCAHEHERELANDAAVVKLPALLWSSLRVHAAAARAAASCASSRWPLRHALRPFGVSELLAPPEAQRAGGYLVADIPGTWSSELAVHIPQQVACKLLLAADEWTAHFAAAAASSVASVEPSAAAAALCSAATQQPQQPIWQQLQLDVDEMQQENVLALERRCASAEDGAEGTTSQASAVRQALLDGVLPDGKAMPGAAKVPCNAPLAPEQMLAALTANTAAIHSAPTTTTLHTPDALAAAARSPVPVKNFLPLLMPNAAEVAEAAANRNASALVMSLTPPVLRRALPGVLTSFNVMVSPMGVLTAVRSHATSAHTPTLTETHAPDGSVCPDDLVAVYEPEAPAAVDRENAAMPAFEQAALGGAEARARLRSFAPRATFMPYWPPEAGIDLAESPVDGPAASSATLDVYNVATPVRDDQQVRHSACDAWDVAASEGRARAIVLSEVVVLSHISDLYYWVTVDLVGRLQLLMRYLEENPHVRVHLSPAAVRAWANNTGHFAAQWLDSLRLRKRVVTGRVLARVAHVVDRTPVGPRVHPLQLLAVRDASERVLAAAGLPPLAQLHMRSARNATATMAGNGNATTPRNDPGSLLLLQRAPNSARSVANLGQLRFYLKPRRLRSTVWDPPASSAGSLAAAIVAWAAADAVVAPHGSGLANAAFMRPGATVIETVPRGHAGCGMYYLQLAHVVRVRHHHIVVPGTLDTSITLPIILVEALLCGDAVNHTIAAVPIKVDSTAPFAGGQCAPASASSLPRRDREHGDLWAATQRHHAQLLECLPVPRPARVPLTADEPVFALLPVTDLQATMPCNTARNGTQTHRVMMSFPWVLPLSQVRAVALLIPAGDRHASFFSQDPTQRALVRGLEAARVLPLALPNRLCCQRTQPICYLNFTENCGGPHASVLLSLVGEVVRRVAAARGIAPAQVPIVAVGVSSGAGMIGTLGAHIQLAAAVAQLEPPSRLMLRLHSGAVNGTSPTACRISNSTAVTVETQDNKTTSTPASHLVSMMSPASPATPPALWLTAASANGIERREMERFGRAWQLRVTNGSAANNADDRYIFNSWAPSPLSAAELHRAAPWLLSRGAASMIIQAALAVGVLQEPTPAQRAAYVAYRPWCPRDGAFSDELSNGFSANSSSNIVHDANQDAPGTASAAGEPALFMPLTEEDHYTRVMASPVIMNGIFRLNVLFRASGKASGMPFFFVAHELSQNSSRDDLLQFANNGIFCEFVIPRPVRELKAQRASLEKACTLAKLSLTVVHGWFDRAIEAMRGQHEYHEAPWADVVAWVSRQLDRLV